MCFGDFGIILSIGEHIISRLFIELDLTNFGFQIPSINLLRQ